MSARTTRRHSAISGRRRFRGDKGYAMILSALLIVPLMAFTGLGVDVGSWYASASRMQRAADAAALAGVVWMPDEGRAEQAALDVAKRNGYDPADSDIDVTVVPVGNQRLRVTIYDADVELYFSSVFLNNVDIERQATAEYVRSIPMGSPTYELANDPERWDEPGYERPYYWLNIAGTRTNKANGDRHTAGNCTGFSGCSGSTNLDYSESGYGFRLTVEDVGVGDLRVQAYDPAFFYEGDTCNNGHLLDPGSGSFAAEVATLQAQGHADAATRFVEGNTPFCSGDQALNGADIETTYLVRAPDDTPFDNDDNPIVCGITFDAYDEQVYPLLDQADGYMDGPIGSENMAFDEHYRQWADLCTIPAGSVELGDYLITVSTTADQSTPLTLGDHDPTVSTGGHNRYAMRAGFGVPSSPSFADGINFFADGRLPIYVNQSGAAAATNFYLARVTPEYAGQLLALEFYDVADGANSDLTIIPPADMVGDPLGPCTFIRDASPPEVITPGNCTITGLNNANYNGRVVSVQIPIPPNYSCALGDEFGCWFKIDLDFNGGSPRDTTTWSARVVGDPVRLVE
jgi:hypothetical protein